VGQIIQWQKENGQKDKQWSTKHYTEINDWATQNHQKLEVNSGAPEGLVVPAPLVTLCLSLINDTNIIWYGNCVGHQYAQYA
jgi:hypothetical protein